MSVSRRNFMLGALGGGLLAPLLALERALARADSSAARAKQISERAHDQLTDFPGLKMHGSEQVAMLVYPGMTMLDMVGPQYFFASMMGAKVHLVSKDEDLSPVMGDTGFAVVPTLSFADCPAQLDVLFVPGGTSGTLKAMNDKQTIDFLVDRGSRAKNITSVCTGSILLGQAGLLEGKKATSHWVARELLPEFGAVPVDARVVSDGNVITGAGVSAGIDFALAMVARLRGEPYAHVVQLSAEYHPEPPFNAGSPETIDPKLGEPMREMFSPFTFGAREAARQRRRRG